MRALTLLFTLLMAGSPAYAGPKPATPKPPATAKSYGDSFTNRVLPQFKVPEKWVGKHYQILLIVRVDATGKVTSTKIHSSSGLKEFDELALKAVYDSQPYPVPPKEAVDQDIQLVLTSD